MADFITKAENARRLGIIIVCVIIDAVALAVGIYAIKETNFVTEKPDNTRNIKKLTEEVSAAREANKMALNNYLTYAKDIGWRREAVGTLERFPTSALQGEILKSYLSNWAVELRKLDITKYKRWDEASGGENLLLTKLFDELLAKENEYKTKIEDLKKQIEDEQNNEKKVAQDTETANAAVMKDIDGGVAANQPSTGLIGEVIRLSKELNTLQKSHAEEVAALEVETIAKQNEATTVKNENVRKRAAYDATKSDFKRRIYTIQHHREEARERREPDGEILSINEERKLAYINLLRKDRLFKGTKFTCYSLEKGGQKLDKGVIEVIEVREDLSSVCAIVSTVDPNWPLKAGDKVYNEMYEGGRARHIAIAGRFTGKLSNEEAAGLIRNSGDFYQDKVDEKTNYVVVADGYEEHPNYKAALEYGIKILREKILYDYLGVRRD